jgi:hopene-associated glycosyltransferase HpnB
MHPIAALLSCLALGCWIYLTFFHAGFWQLALDGDAPEPEKWPSIDIIVPARNEANVLPRSLSSLLAQDYPGMWRVFLVDDHSTDGTGALAQKLATNHNANERLAVIAAPDLPVGWSGKVAAMQAGVAQSTADYVLFTDADIEHPVDSLRRLASHAVERKIDLVSRMVRLHCRTPAEKLLIPAFVFFFMMLYPFWRVNDADSDVAAAAGGVMLVRRKALDSIGGLARIKSALIDDCALAKAIKQHGGPLETPARIELTLARDIKSLRVYPYIDDIGRMIARTAYTQLQYSPVLLAVTIFGMAVLFIAPMLFPVTGWPLAAEAGLATWLVMSLIYLPMIRFYELPVVWALSLPAAAFIYMLATIDSAKLYWQGKGGQWKGRTQA